MQSYNILMHPLKLLILLFPVVLADTAAGARLSSGPMLGPVTAETAIVWAQADGAAQLSLEYWPERYPEARHTLPPRTLNPDTDFSAQLMLTGLAPATRWNYRLLLDNRPAGTEHRFTTLPLPYWAYTPLDFTAYLGSCAFINDAGVDHPGTPYGSSLEIFDTIARAAVAETQPAFMLWLGDNIYLRDADLVHPWGMNRRYRSVRATPELQTLLAALPHYAIWDDHDYGPNDANRSFVFKGDSLKLFQRYWPNPGAGLPETSGTFTRFSMGDAEFFLLDDRSYRAADLMADDSPDKTLYGPGQLDWLKNALMQSRASFKIIAGGSQFLNDASRFEGWQHFPAEREAFLDWLARNRINGVLFVSGDRHHTELLRRERAGSYPLYELTCSPLTSGTRPADDNEINNPLRVADTTVAVHNYCTLATSGERGQRSLTLTVFDAQGRRLWAHILPASSLKTPHPAR